MKKILFLIPAFNEEKNITNTINSIYRCRKNADILVVDDGSTDQTVKKINSSKVAVVSHPYNLGYGTALQTGYKYALENDYDIVAQMDADGQHDPQYFQGMIELLLKENLDVIVGSRFLHHTNYRTTAPKRIGILFFNLIASLVTKRKVTDSTSGFQVIGKKVLPFLTSDFFPFDYPDADLLIMLHFNNFKVKEFPVKMYNSKTGKSMHNSTFRNMYYILKMCLSIYTQISRKVTGLNNK